MIIIKISYIGCFCYPLPMTKLFNVYHEGNSFDGLSLLLWISQAKKHLKFEKKFELGIEIEDFFSIIFCYCTGIETLLYSATSKIDSYFGFEVLWAYTGVWISGSKGTNE